MNVLRESDSAASSTGDKGNAVETIFDRSQQNVNTGNVINADIDDIRNNNNNNIHGNDNDIADAVKTSTSRIQKLKVIFACPRLDIIKILVSGNPLNLLPR